MVDDLTLHGVTEPYRMMTARAEFRLHLRADNAMTRLGAAAIAAACVSDSRQAAIKANAHAITLALDRLAILTPEHELTGSGADKRSLAEWLRRPATRHAALERLGSLDESLTEAIADADYAPYLERQRAEWAMLDRDRALALPAAFAFASIPGLSTEMIELLSAARPATIDQASRVRGVTPAALSALHFAIAKAA